MSKLAYVLMTLVGAVPAGGTNYLLVKHFLDHGFSGSPIIVAVCATAWTATFFTALTPLMVLFWYKAPQSDTVKSAGAVVPKEDGSKPEKPAKAKTAKGEGFDDAIPDDFDEDELNESADDAFDAGDEDFEYEDDEFEEEESPKKKKKK